MPEVNVEFDVTDVLRAVNRLGTQSKNIPMDVLGQLLVSEADDVFQSQGATGSDGQWEPMSPATVKRWPRRAGGMLLQATGATAALQVEVAGDSVTVFSPTAQAKHHISGTENMPKRDFFALRFDAVLEALGDLVLQEFQR